MTNPHSAWNTWSLDREVVVSRLIDAAPDAVFAAWTDPAQIVQWFGPQGFGITTQAIDIRPGGHWQFDMVAPDGTVFPNQMTFRQITAPKVIEVSHGSGADPDPDRFDMRVSFDAQDNGKTVLTLRQLHPTADRRTTVLRFGAVEFGGQTLDKLADHLRR